MVSKVVPLTFDATDWLVVDWSTAELELLLISDQGIVMEADDPLIEGMIVVTSIGMKLDDLVVAAKNSSAGDVVVTLELEGGVMVETMMLPSWDNGELVEAIWISSVLLDAVPPASVCRSNSETLLAGVEFAPEKSGKACALENELVSSEPVADAKDGAIVVTDDEVEAADDVVSKELEAAL